jgi:hypothetical protein
VYFVQFGVFNRSYRDKKVVSVFVRSCAASNIYMIDYDWFNI